MHSRIGDGNDESDDGDSDGVGDDGDDKDGQRSRRIALHIGIVIKYWAADIVYTLVCNDDDNDDAYKRRFR